MRGMRQNPISPEIGGRASLRSPATSVIPTIDQRKRRDCLAVDGQGSLAARVVGEFDRYRDHPARRDRAVDVGVNLTRYDRLGQPPGHSVDQEMGRHGQAAVFSGASFGISKNVMNEMVGMPGSSG
jgi:hypothetical protein